jgi:hypothetical protein
VPSNVTKSISGASEYSGDFENTENFLLWLLNPKLLMDLTSAGEYAAILQLAAGLKCLITALDNRVMFILLNCEDKKKFQDQNKDQK